jgi:hypothetical protein
MLLGGLLGKATLLTPLYLSVAWILMASYQLFTETTVESLTSYINYFIPTIGAWMALRIDMIVFIHSFAWIFLLSSAIPSLILGKGRSVLVQFGVCLTLAFLAFVIQDVLTAQTSGALNQILGISQVFQNPLLATLYLSIPYLLMLGFDIKSKLKYEKVKTVERETNDFPEDAFLVQDDVNEEEKIQEEELAYPH